MYIPHEQYEFRDRVAERLSDKDKKKKTSDFTIYTENHNKQTLFKILNYVPRLLTARRRPMPMA
jgi:hypothetical protein